MLPITMFTGIVEETGTIVEAQSPRLAIQAGTTLQGLRPGDSIAVNGACLTPVSVGENTFAVDLSEETVQRTNLGSLQLGTLVNLERAVPIGGRMGGHIVQGHVDAVGHVVQVHSLADSTIIHIEAPSQILRYIVEKGFIAMDGVSLTVTEHDTTSFNVSVVPYTLRYTSLSQRRVGDAINLEVDILAKYIERLVTGERRES